MDKTTISNLIQNSLGITDLENYGEYKKEKHDNGLTPEEIELLSPDRLRSSDFWEWTAKSPFEKDTITYGMESERDINECNFRNHLLALETGMLNYYFKLSSLLRRGDLLKVLEIGPGFGAFKEVCDHSPRGDVEYWGVDVYPRIDGVLPIMDGDTKFPDIVATQKFDLVYSSNVFQHLSPRQRVSYIIQAAEVLHPRGIFSFNTAVYQPDTGFRCGEKRYMCHYGQYTEMEPFDTYLKYLAPDFKLLATCQRDCIVTFHCQKKIKAERLPDPEEANLEVTLAEAAE